MDIMSSQVSLFHPSSTRKHSTDSTGTLMRCVNSVTVRLTWTHLVVQEQQNG